MEKVRELEDQKRALINEMRGNVDYENILPKIRKIEDQIREERIKARLNEFNRKQEKKRNWALKVWEALEDQQPHVDITNQDGSFHAVKVKKYPGLAELAKEHARAKFKGHLMTEIRYQGEGFQLVETDYKNGETSYNLINTFKKFLEVNSIQESDLTLEEFKKMLKDIEVFNLELEAAIKKYDQGLKDLNASFYRYHGLLDQDNNNVYKTIFRA
jgi:uncharacterized protein (UPF0216 family)